MSYVCYYTEVTYIMSYVLIKYLKFHNNQISKRLMSKHKKN